MRLRLCGCRSLTTSATPPVALMMRFHQDRSHFGKSRSQGRIAPADVGASDLAKNDAGHLTRVHLWYRLACRRGRVWSRALSLCCGSLQCARIGLDFGPVLTSIARKHEENGSRTFGNPSKTTAGFDSVFIVLSFLTGSIHRSRSRETSAVRCRSLTISATGNFPPAARLTPYSPRSRELEPR